MKRAIILFLILCSVAHGANEIRSFTNCTAAFAVVREIDGDVWYVSGQVFEAWGTGLRTAADYDIALTKETGGMFTGTFDTNISAGYYYVITHDDADSTPADADPAVWEEYGYWTGTAWGSGDDKIGVPVALDGGTATIAGMLTKMVDDNDGADYNAARESLEMIRTRGDLAWTTGVGASSSETYQIATLTRTVGDNDGGTIADVNVVDGSTFDTGEIATTTKLEVDATFTAGVGMNPVSVNLWGYYDGGGGHYMIVQAYNYIDSTFEEIGTIGNSSIVSYYSFQLGHGHIHPTTGAMAIKFLHSAHAGITAHSMIIDKIIVTASAFSNIPADTADAVWDELVADHTGETTFGGEVGGLDPNITLILADTNELQTDWTNGGRLDLLIDAIKYKTDLISLVDTVVKDSNDANSFTIENGTDVNDAYWFAAIQVEDADDNLSKEIRWIIYYDENSTDPNIWVDRPFSFTPAVGDVVHIMGTSYGGLLYDIWRNLQQTRGVLNVVDRTSGGTGGLDRAGAIRIDSRGDDP